MQHNSDTYAGYLTDKARELSDTLLRCNNGNGAGALSDLSLIMTMVLASTIRDQNLLPELCDVFSGVLREKVMSFHNFAMSTKSS